MNYPPPPPPPPPFHQKQQKNQQQQQQQQQQPMNNNNVKKYDINSNITTPKSSQYLPPSSVNQQPTTTNPSYIPNQIIRNQNNASSNIPSHGRTNLPPPPPLFRGGISHHHHQQQQQNPISNNISQNINGGIPPAPNSMNASIGHTTNQYSNLPPPPPRSMNASLGHTTPNQFQPPPPPRSMTSIPLKPQQQSQQKYPQTAVNQFHPPPPPSRNMISAPPPSQHNNVSNGTHNNPNQQKKASTYSPPLSTQHSNKPQTKSNTKPTSKIDPSQIPRPTSTLQSTKIYKSTLPPITSGPPPPPNTRIQYVDSSNATPSILRPISYMFPSQRTIQEKTGLPIGLFITPLGDNSTTIPLFDGSKSIIRCRNCLAYIHPACNYDLNYWTCQFCNTKNSITDYGLVSNIMQYGTIEYNVNNTAYDTRSSCSSSSCTPFIYALHTSMLQDENNITILEHVWNSQLQQYEDNYGIGILLYENHAIYIPYLDEGKVKICITCDMNDPFAILPLHDWLYTSMQQINTIVDFLKNIDNINQILNKDNNKYGYDCLGSVLFLLNDTLKEDQRGGKCIILTTNLDTNIGVGKISKKNPQYIPDVNYKTLTEDCIKNSISFDIFYILGDDNDENDIRYRIPTKYYTSLLYLCYKTCGRLNKIIKKKDDNIDYENVLRLELFKSIESYKGKECILKLRIPSSCGLKIKQIQSHPGTIQKNNSILDDDENNPEIELSACTKNTSISIIFDYKIGGIKDNENIHFQLGFLYTNPLTKNRILRISTITIQSTKNVQDIFRFIDTYALSLCLLRTSCNECLSTTENPNVDTIKHTLMHIIIQILKNYRQNTNARNSPSSQLILPDTCQLLPLLLHSSFTSPLFNNKYYGSMNTRLEFIYTVLYGLNPMYVFLLFYPTHIYSFQHQHDKNINVNDEVIKIMCDDIDTTNTSDLDAVALSNNDSKTYTIQINKNQIYPSRNNFQFDDNNEINKLYLFDNGYDIIYIIPPPNNTNTTTNILYQNNNCNILINYLRCMQLRPKIPRIEIINNVFDDNIIFVDDVGLNGQNYEDFLCFLHKRIRLAMQQQNNY